MKPIDSQSGIVEYKVAIGTQSNIDDVLPYTNVSVGTNTYSYTIPSPISNQRYYFLVWAKNAAGLASNVHSDGQIYIEAAGIGTDHQQQVVIYPNPIKDYIQIQLPKNMPVQAKLYSTNGQLIFDKQIKHSTKLDIKSFHLTSGSYILEIHTKYDYQVLQLIKPE